MTMMIRTALALGLVAAAGGLAFADCAGHVSAEAKRKPVVTADTNTQAPVATDKKG